MEVLVRVVSSSGSQVVYMKLNADVITAIPTKWMLGIHNFNVQYPIIYEESELPSQYLLVNAGNYRLTFNNCTASFLYWHKNREVTCKLEALEEAIPF